MAENVQGPRARVAPGYQAISHSRGYGRQLKNPRRVPHLALDSDKEARRAWRQNKQPDDYYDLPSGFNPNKEVGSFESFKFVEATTGTHISLRQRKGSADNNIYVAEIWGDRRQCQQAKDAIFDYIHNSDPRGHKTFAKVGSDRGGHVEALLHEQLKREQKQLKYCRLPEGQLMNRRYAYSIVVPWKEQEHGWRVEDMLGQQLEALDEIRMDSHCYILLSRQGQETNFLLLGNNHDTMMEAVSRIQQIPARIISHALPPTQLYLLKPLPSPFDYSAFKVELVDYHRPQYLLEEHRLAADEDKAGRFLKLKPSGIHERQFLSDDVAAVTSLEDFDEQGAIWLGSRHAAILNAQYLNLWISRALSQLTVYRGHIQMELNIGTCVYERHKAQPELDAETLEDVLLDLNSGAVELGSFMAADLGDHQGKHLLERFLDNRPQFVFYDNFLNPGWNLQQCLDACHPRLKAAFVIEQGPADNLRLELEFKKNSINEYDEVYRRWMKLKDDDVVPGEFLSVNILDLEQPDASYELKIERCDMLNELRENKLRTVYHQFANKVKPEAIKEPMYLAKNKRLFFIPANGTGSQVKLRACEQSRSWLFSMKDSGYYVEVYAKSMIDIRPENEPDSQTTYKPRPREEFWGMRVWHEQWPGLFSQNKELGIGRNTQWLPTEAQFFPSGEHLGFETMEGLEAEVGAGFDALLRVAKTVEGVAKGAVIEEKKAVHAFNPIAADTDALIARGSALNVSSEASVTAPPSYELSPSAQAQNAVAASDKPVFAPAVEFADDFDDMVRITPNMGKKRLGTTTAKRDAVIGSLEAPKSSADVRIAAHKSFASIDAKLNAQSSQVKKPSEKPAAAKRKGKGKKKGGLQSTQPASPTVKDVGGTDGSWGEIGGPKGHMPKLPTPPGVRPKVQPQAGAAIQPAAKSWATVAGGVKTNTVVGGKPTGRDSDGFPVWQVVKK